MACPSRRTDALRSTGWTALAVATLALTACDRDQVSRSAPAPLPTQQGALPAAGPGAAPAPMPGAGGTPGGTPGGMPGGMSGAEVPPPPAPDAPLHWSVPKGWTQTPGSGMRFATLTPPAGNGKAECSVICLPGQAGGELANVNRWRGQIGLEPLDEKGIASNRHVVKSHAGPVAVFDFTSQGAAQTRMLAAILVAKDGQSWFLKLVGDAPAVAKARPDYLRFLETLRLD
jgi:hypothetical protein